MFKPRSVIGILVKVLRADVVMPTLNHPAQAHGNRPNK